MAGKDRNFVELRHCAFCLKDIPAASAKVCAKCTRRAYCSRECQKLDWGMAGQNHRFWCDKNCGEEDVEWEVRWISAVKGMGVVAKWNLPRHFRIMVDRCYDSIEQHGPLMLLEPVHGTTQEKFDLNRVGRGDRTCGRSAVCARLSRINHNCYHNAAHWYDAKHNVKIVYSDRPILAGEEVCIAYLSFSDQSGQFASASEMRSVLQNTWGIKCSEDCLCYDRRLASKIAHSKKLDLVIKMHAEMYNFRMALQAVLTLLELQDELPPSAAGRIRTLFDGFQVAMLVPEARHLAKQFITQAYILAYSVAPEDCIAQHKAFMDSIV